MNLREVKFIIKSVVNNENYSVYHLSQLTGISENALHSLKKGVTKIENIKLDNAIKLVDLYESKKEEFEMTTEERDMKFGRLFGAICYISERVFEKGRQTVEQRYFLRFQQQPMTIIAKAHLDIMERQYTEKFGEEEHYALDVITELIASMDGTGEYTDAPLGNTWLLGKSKQLVELRELDNE